MARLVVRLGWMSVLLVAVAVAVFAQAAQADRPPKPATLTANISVRYTPDCAPAGYWVIGNYKIRLVDVDPTPPDPLYNSYPDQPDDVIESTATPTSWSSNAYPYLPPVMGTAVYFGFFAPEDEMTVWNGGVGFTFYDGGSPGVNRDSMHGFNYFGICKHRFTILAGNIKITPAR